MLEKYRLKPEQIIMEEVRIPIESVGDIPQVVIERYVDIDKTLTAQLEALQPAIEEAKDDMESKWRVKLLDAGIIVMDADDIPEDLYNQSYLDNALEHAKKEGAKGLVDFIEAISKCRRTTSRHRVNYITLSKKAWTAILEERKIIQ